MTAGVNGGRQTTKLIALSSPRRNARGCRALVACAKTQQWLRAVRPIFPRRTDRAPHRRWGMRSLQRILSATNCASQRRRV